MSVSSTPSRAIRNDRTATPAIPDSLLRDLRNHLFFRRIADGIALLEAHSHLFDSLRPEEENAAAFLSCVAQWVDSGYGETTLVEQLVARFPQSVRARLPVGDYLQLRMAEGILGLLHDEPDEALRHLDFVLALLGEMADKELLAISQLWNARCHRRKGEYDDAMKHAAQAHALAVELGFDKMAAVVRVLQSWLLFQEGQRRESARMLDEAESVLRHTDDDITLGNIYSAHGRMIRRKGRYHESLQFFAKAIRHYQKRNLQHRNLARSLVNIAYVQRLIAVEISRQIDARIKRRRKKGGGATISSDGKARWKQYEQLRADAFANLEEAETIYRHHNHHHGLGSIHENRGLLYLDIGDLDHASAEAAKAYALGKQENDSILMARACLLQCRIENAKLEEEIEGSQHSWDHAQAARDFAREAVEAATHTQNQRLLARAYVWRGLTSSNRFFNDLEDAKHCCDKAIGFLKTVDAADLGDELQLLKQKLIPKGSIDPVLRSWSQGITGEKTFQQMTEQFAELVIPRVWEQEGKKVLRVAKRLSISPKKVRRILNRVGKT